jgi:hypothetical protein
VPHDRRALIDQLRALLTQQRYSSVVIHNYCRSAEHFLEYLAQRAIAADAATPDHVSGYLYYAGRRFRRRQGHTRQRRGGSPFRGQESTRYFALCRNDGHPSRRPPARVRPFADRYATSTGSGCMRSAASRKRPSAR